MSKQFTVDDTLYRAKAKKLVRQLKLNEEQVLREQAGQLAELMTKVAPPFESFPKFSAGYTNKGARQAGVDSVKSGFSRAVQGIGKLGGWKDKNIRKAIRAGDLAYLTQRFRYMKNSPKEGLTAKPYSDRERNRLRNRRGRVSSGTQPFVGVTDRDVKAGRRRAINNVGIAKASLAKVAVQLGRKSPPKWIYKHFSKVTTRANFSRNPSIISFRANAKGLDVVERNAKRIERFRMKAMVKRLEALARAESKQAGFKVK